MSADDGQTDPGVSFILSHLTSEDVNHSNAYLNDLF